MDQRAVVGMRVCQFSILPPSECGGVESVVRDLTVHLNKLGIETTSIWSQEKYAGPLRSILSTTKIISRRNDFDIINTHGYSGFGLSFVPKRFRNSKHVVTFHGTWINYFDAMGCRGVKDRLIRKASIWVEKRAMRDCDYGIAVSKYVKESVVEQYGVDEDKISVVYNGVDCRRFKPRTREERKKRALWVGTNARLKGLKEAINAVRGLPLELMVVGISGRNRGNIKYLGRISPKKMPEIYNMADFLILPSKYESFPSVVMEALASGLPVIISPECHCEILNERCGIVTHDYRGAVERLLKEDLVKMRENCRKLAEKYDWSIQAKKYAKIYKRLVK